MHWLLTLLRANERTLFPTDLDHALFLDRLTQLTRRWQVELRSFALGGPEARLLLHGSEASVGQVCRLQQSGWGVWRHHRGDFVCWEPSVREWIGGDRPAVDVADRLHQDGGLAWPWTSLREGLGLRHSPWLGSAWLGRRPPQSHLAAVSGEAWLPGPVPPGWRSAAPLTWDQIEGAVLHATGRDPDGRAQRVLRTRLAWSGGWAVRSIADVLAIQPRAVARTLRLPPDPAWAVGRILLHDSRLRPPGLDGTGQWATAADLEVPCPATPSSWTVLAG